METKDTEEKIKFVISALIGARGTFRNGVESVINALKSHEVAEGMSKINYLRKIIKDTEATLKVSEQMLEDAENKGNK